MGQSTTGPVRASAGVGALSRPAGGSALGDAAAQAPAQPGGSPDEELVLLARQGRAEAFAALVERYERKVYGLAYRMSGSPDDAADLAQEAFIRIWRKLAEFRGDSTFSTWVYRVTVNVCLDRRRQDRRRPTVSLDAPSDGASGPPERQVADGGPGPDAALESAELHADIQREIARLPAEYRAALVLRDVEGHAYQEIADILSISLGTVKSRISRGRQLLKERFLALELFSRPAV